MSGLRNFIYRSDLLYPIFRPLFGFRPNLKMLVARLKQGIDMNLAVFSCYQGRSYNDNPRYISEALHEMRPETEIIWICKDPDSFVQSFPVPDYVRCVKKDSDAAWSTLGRARVLVDNFRKQDWLHLSRKQRYLHSAHYDRGFKRVALDNPDFTFRRVVEEKCSRITSGSAFFERIVRTSFRYKGELLRVGSPRNDILLRNDPAEAQAIRGKLGIADGTGVLLYAPTYRDVQVRAKQGQAVNLDLNRVLSTLERCTGKPWVCLYRAHYMALGLSCNEASGKLIDASGYPEMAELMLIADAMITDYSSCCGDYPLLHRPVYLYQPDAEDYCGNNRSLYFRFEELPYWRATSPEALDELIEQTTPERARENCEEIIRFFGMYESGHAAEEAAKYLCTQLR